LLPSFFSRRSIFFVWRLGFSLWDVFTLPSFFSRRSIFFVWRLGFFIVGRVYLWRTISLSHSYQGLIILLLGVFILLDAFSLHFWVESSIAGRNLRRESNLECWALYSIFWALYTLVWAHLSTSGSVFP